MSGVAEVSGVAGRVGSVAFALLLLLGAGTGLSGQVRIDDLVVTMGFAGERYAGNLASVTVPVVDSTDRAHSLFGEVGIRGRIVLIERDQTLVSTDFDMGVRQFVAGGFALRDYAPRERVGRAEVAFLQGLGEFGVFSSRATVRARAVDDRPPMPLYLQAGFDQLTVDAAYRTPSFEGVAFDLRVDGERADYEQTPGLDQLRLLDRRSSGVEVGMSWGDEYVLRVFGGRRWTEYPEQSSFDPEDPYRRDRTVNVGGSWSYESSWLFAEVGLLGTINRSNSRRPEYDAISLTGDFSAPLPVLDLGVSIYGALTGKSYIQETQFARLVPGEEADNASVFFLDLNRSLADNLDATIRLGWTRAETDIGDSYYGRYGMSFLLNYRPLAR